METKETNLEVNLDRVSTLSEAFNKVSVGYNQAEIALAFSAFLAAQAAAFAVQNIEMLTGKN